MINLKSWAKALKRDVMTLWFALKHPLTPWYARAFAAVLTAYALSPIDLIPDFIPILGYLDEFIILPILIMLAIRLIPNAILEAARNQATEHYKIKNPKPHVWFGAILILCIWVLIIYHLLEPTLQGFYDQHR